VTNWLVHFAFPLARIGGRPIDSIKWDHVKPGSRGGLAGNVILSN
jgi:hypothetical protein